MNEAKRTLDITNIFSPRTINIKDIIQEIKINEKAEDSFICSFNLSFIKNATAIIKKTAVMVKPLGVVL